MEVSKENRSDTDAVLPLPYSVWSVELKLTHVDCNPNQPLVHFQGQHLLVCELDYNILHSEIQNAVKIQGTAEIGTFCLVEDCFSGQWYRGRVHHRCGKMFDVFLLDYGSILSCDESHIASASDDHLILPPKIVCGFFANILPNGETWDSIAMKYFSKLIGQEIKGYIQAVLPCKVLILEIPDIKKELLQQGSGKTVDRNTFLVIVEMLTELSVKDWKPIPHLLSERNLTQKKNPVQQDSFQGLLNIFPYCLPELNIGEKLSVKITAASTLSLFFCQLMNKARDLEVLTQKLKHFCESYIGDFKENNSGISDRLCAVKGKSNMWYRGLIQHVLPNGNIVVFFLDFGYSDIVKSDHILPVVKDFFSEPVMAFPCTLTCLAEQDEELLKLQTDQLKDGLLGGIVLACVDRFSVAQSRYYVTLFSLHNSSEKKNQGTLSIDHPITTTNMNTLPEVSHVFDLSIKRLDDSCFCENMEFKENSSFVGYIEHILHPSHFWMRSDDRNAEFEDMMEEINNLYSGKELEDNILQTLIPGVWCCAMFDKDWTYYRAVIVDIFEQGAEVFFVDFGNTEMVPFMYIKEMPCELSKIPAFAFPCSLAHVVPIEDVWTVKATDVFKKLVMNKVLLVRVALIQKDKYIVDIHDKENNKISVASALAMAGHAEYWKNTTINVNFKEKKQMESSCHHLQKKELGSNSWKKTSENLPLREDALKQQTIPASKIPQAQNRFLTKQDGKMVLPTQCLSKHKLFIKPLIFKPGMVVDVIVSLIISPFEFWCQLKNQSSKFKLLVGQLQQYYRVNNFVFQPDENVCIAKCARNGQWHRGFITRYCGSSVDVFFVDLGVTETKPICEIQAIKPEFTHLEGQAFRCSFYLLIEPTVDFPYWNENACKIFKEMVENSNSLFTCTILGLVSKGKILCCIVDMKNHFFVANQFLIDSGVARKTENLCITSAFFHTYLYCSFNLMLGNEEKVHITHVKSPFELYCQLDRNSQMLEDLMSKVSKVASERQNQSSSDIQWKLCLALYSRDGFWYRGLCHPLPSPLHFNVHFVDYGNMEIIEKKNIIPILAKEKDLIYTPVQAVKCSLLNIPKGELIPEVLAYLEENILNKTLNAIISGKETDGSIVVELYDGKIQVNKKVKEIIDKNFQKSDSLRRQLHKICNINHRAVHLEKYCTSDTTKMKQSQKNQKVSVIRTDILCKAVSECSLMNVMPKKTPELECTQKKPRFRKENKYTGVMHINRDCKSTCEKECNTPEYSDLPSRKFNTGWKTDACISHVNSIFDFFIQLAKDKFSIVNMGKELSDSLNKQKEHFVGHVKINDLVALESENHETFYRAVVKNLSSNSQLLVELIDYGKGILADKSKLYKIPYNFVKKPRLSIHCCSFKSDLVGSDFPFRVEIPEQPVRVQFVKEQGERWVVNINITEAGFLSPQNSTLQSSDLKKKNPENLSHPDDTFPAEQLCAKENGKNIYMQDINVSSEFARKKRTESKTDFSVKPHIQNIIEIPCMDLNIKQKEACILLFVLRNGDVYANLIKNDNFSWVTPYIMEHLQKCCSVTVEDVRERLHYLGVPKTYGLCYRAKLNHITLTDKVTFFIINCDDIESYSLSKIKQLHSNLRSGLKEIILCDLKGSEPLKEISEILISHLKNFSSHPFEAAFLSAFGDPVVQQVNIRVNEMSNIVTQLAGAERCCPLLRLFTPSYNFEKNLIPEPQYFFESVQTDGEYLGYAAEAALPFEFYFHLEDSSEKMTTLYAMLQQLPEDLPNLPAKFIHQGVPCLIKCEIKGMWCRAVIKAIFSTFILVLLVDYGNKILVSEIGKLKQIPKLLVTVPCNVMPCLLKGVEPVNGMKWREEAVTFFQDCLFQQQLLVCFRQRTCKGVWEVDVRINDVDVAQMMIAAGQAVFVQSNFLQQLKPRQLHYPELEQEANENNMLKQTCLAPSKKPQPQNKVPNCNII